MGMSKRQKTGDDVHDTAFIRTHYTDDSTDVGTRGTMLTTACPPNMNMVEISDTISDLEGENRDTENTEVMPQYTSEISKSKRKRKKRKELTRKHKKQATDSSIDCSHTKTESTQSSSVG